jgi:WD40 repeat protein
MKQQNRRAATIFCGKWRLFGQGGWPAFVLARRHRKIILEKAPIAHYRKLSMFTAFVYRHRRFISFLMAAGLFAAPIRSGQAQVTAAPQPAIEIIAQRAHADRIIDVAISPDGRYLATAGRDNLLKIWNMDGTLLKNVSQKGRRVAKVGYAPDGRSLFAVCDRSEVVLYDRLGNYQRKLSGDDFDISALALDAAGRTIITTDGSGSVMIRNSAWQIEKRILAHQDNITCLDISPDGKYFVTGSNRPTASQAGWDTSVRLWDREGNWVREIETEMAQSLGGQGEAPSIRDPQALRFSPDGQHIAILGAQRWVHVRSIAGELISRFQLKNSVAPQAVMFSADGRNLIFPVADAIEIHDLKGALKQRWPVTTSEERGRIACLAASPDGAHFVVALLHYDPKPRAGLKILDGQGQLAQAIYPQDIAIESVGLAPDLSQIIFETQRGQSSLIYPVNGTNLDFVPASIGFDGQGQPYRYAFDRPRSLHLSYGPVEKELKLKFEKNSYFVTPLRQIIQVHPSFEELVFFDFSGAARRRIAIDKYHTGGMGLFQQHSFSPAGDYLIVETDRNNGSVHSLTRVRLSDGQRLNRIDVGLPLSAYAISPRGDLILTGHGNGEIAIWSPEGRRLQQIKAHSMAVTGLAIDPTERFVISTSQDQSVKIWDRQTHRSLTMVLFQPEDWFAYDADGHFDCSPAARERVHFVKGLAAYHFRQFWRDFYQPGLIGRFLQGEQPKAAKLANQIDAAPRVRLQLENDRRPGESQATVTLKVCVQAAANGIGRIVLFHNGRAVDETSRGIVVRSEGSCKAFVPRLLPGKNIFYAAAYDRSQQVSGESQTLVVHFAPETLRQPEMYVMSVGISEYQDKNIALKYPADDATAVSDILRRQSVSLYGKVHSELLTNDSASKANILKKMDLIARAAQKSDTVILYLAGHGDTEKEQYYFLSYDTDITDLAGTSIALNDVRRFMQALTANKIAIFLDTCKSGRATQLLAMGGLARGFEERKILANLARESGIAVFSAASKTQAAYEIPSLEHGIFTYCLLDALQNRTSEIANGELISLSKLLGVVNHATRDTARKYLDVEQSPIIYMFGDDFSLGLIHKKPGVVH